MQVVHHPMAMIGTHYDRTALRVGDFDDCLQDFGHAGIAAQMLGLMEIALACFPADRAEMEEVDPVGKAPDHGGQVVVRPRAERAGAEAQSVRHRRYGGIEMIEVVGRADHTGQAENGEGRVVGMDDERNADFLGDRADRTQEGDMVGAQCLGVDPGIAVDRAQKGGGVEAFFAAGKSCDDRAFELVAFLRRHRGEALGGGGANGLRIIRLGARTAQDMDVIGRYRRPFETQRGCTVGQLPVQVGARPVEQWHEIIGHGPHALGRQVAQTVAISLNEFVGQLAPLDRIVHRQAFHRRPAEPGRLDHRAPLGDRLARPHHAVGNFMERGDDLGGARLTDMGQVDRVGGSEPPHRLDHQHVRYPRPISRFR